MLDTGSLSSPRPGDVRLLLVREYVVALRMTTFISRRLCFSMARVAATQKRIMPMMPRGYILIPTAGKKSVVAPINMAAIPTMMYW